MRHSPFYKMKKRKSKIVLTFLFFAGLLVALYPAISNALANVEQASIIQDYEEQVQEMDETNLDSEWEKAAAYNASISGEIIKDPFILGSGSVVPDNYNEVLSLENEKGVMGYIEIPSIQVSLPIYHGVSDAVLQKGVGHMQSTALPVGGKGTHSVLAAHRGLSSAKLFTDLNKVRIGDTFTIYVLNHKLIFQVDQILVIEPEDTKALQPIEGEEYVTLLTCTPYGVNSHRLLVRGCKISDELIREKTDAKNSQTKAEPQMERPWLSYVLMMLPAAVVVFIFFCLIWRRKSSDKK